MTSEPIQIATRRAFRADGMGWVWETDHGVTLRVDYLGIRSDEMYGEIHVLRDGRHIHLARFNLSSTSSRNTLVRALQSQTPRGVEIPWPQLVEQFCVGVMRHEREGEAVQYTRDVPRRPIQYLIDHLAIEGKTNMLFAPGGSGKGYLCVALCCAVATRHGLGDLSVKDAVPFYFDWEDDFQTFQDRLVGVAHGMGVKVPSIGYWRVRGSVPDRINEMARHIAEAGATFAVLDSVSAAAGTTDRSVAWDTIAHRLFDALDRVPNVTWLLVDHVSSDHVADPSGKAYGSIQKMNRVRNAWEMRSEQEPGGKIVHVKLFDAKWNHTGKRKPMGIRMEFLDDKVLIDSEDPERPNNVPSVSVATRMALQLAARPMTTKDLAQACKVSTGTVRVEVSRNPDRFHRDDNDLIHLVRHDEPAEALPW